MCTSCHGSETLTRTRMSREEWKAEVDNMMARGAQGTDAEVQLVVDYLARNLAGPAGSRKPPSQQPARLR